MNLRLYRTFHWTHADVPLSEMRIGGPPAPLVLVHRDELQMQLPDGQWAPVPVVEAEKPEHPQERARREQEAEHAAQMQRMLEENPDFFRTFRLKPGLRAGAAPQDGTAEG